jgi:hypothetical protein
MTDRELLEAAAKAIGGEYRDHSLGGQYLAYPPGWNGHPWNPLIDDGDALRLAVKLRMEVYHADDDGWFAYASHPSARGIAYAVEPHGEDASAATRRAIVRAAAVMAEESPG